MVVANHENYDISHCMFMTLSFSCHKADVIKSVITCRLTEGQLAKICMWHKPYWHQKLEFLSGLTISYYCFNYCYINRHNLSWQFMAAYDICHDMFMVWLCQHYVAGFKQKCLHILQPFFYLLWLVINTFWCNSPSLFSFISLNGLFFKLPSHLLSVFVFPKVWDDSAIDLWSHAFILQLVLCPYSEV